MKKLIIFDRYDFESTKRCTTADILGDPSAYLTTYRTAQYDRVGDVCTIPADVYRRAKKKTSRDGSYLTGALDGDQVRIFCGAE